jgi:hypothetical protein
MNKAKLPGLTDEDVAFFESTLAEADPVPGLRKFAQELSSQGLNQREIYLRFLAFYERLQTAEREREENILGDVMDMIVDTYPPHNLNIPK